MSKLPEFYYRIKTKGIGRPALYAATGHELHALVQGMLAVADDAGFRPEELQIDIIEGNIREVDLDDSEPRDEEVRQAATEETPAAPGG